MRKALTDQKHDMIKAHILDPENSPLNPEQQEILDRVISISKVIDKNPVQKHAINIHLAKYSHIGKTQAYEDLRLAIKLFNTLHTFDYDLWQSWLLNDIVQNIENARNGNTHQDRKVIAMEHANLIRALGEKPEELPDPRRTEKHNFFFLLNIENNQIQIDFNQLQRLPPEVLRELNTAIYGGKEITDVEAEEIMST